MDRSLTQVENYTEVLLSNLSYRELYYLYRDISRYIILYYTNEHSKKSLQKKYYTFNKNHAFSTKRVASSNSTSSSPSWSRPANMAASLASLPNDLLGSPGSWGQGNYTYCIFASPCDGMVCHFVQANEEIKWRRTKVWRNSFCLINWCCV